MTEDERRLSLDRPHAHHLEPDIPRQPWTAPLRILVVEQRELLQVFRLFERMARAQRGAANRNHALAEQLHGALTRHLPRAVADRQVQPALPEVADRIVRGEM